MVCHEIKHISCILLPLLLFVMSPCSSTSPIHGSHRPVTEPALYSCTFQGDLLTVSCIFLKYVSKYHRFQHQSHYKMCKLSTQTGTLSLNRLHFSVHTGHEKNMKNMKGMWVGIFLWCSANLIVVWEKLWSAWWKMKSTSTFHKCYKLVDAI